MVPAEMVAPPPMSRWFEPIKITDDPLASPDRSAMRERPSSRAHSVSPIRSMEDILHPDEFEEEEFEPAPPPAHPEALTLDWPVSPAIITSPFGYRRDPMLGPHPRQFHAGVDLGSKRGRVVTSAGPGRVVRTGYMGGCGRTVVVEHPDGYQTLYGHLSRILAKAGDEVDGSTPLGLVGSTGRSTGPHLHFEVRHDGRLIDPRRVVKADFILVSNEHPRSIRAAKSLPLAQTLALHTPTKR